MGKEGRNWSIKAGEVRQGKEGAINDQWMNDTMSTA